MNLRSVRAHAPAVRRGLGVAILGVVFLMILGVDKDLQTRVPEYTRALQRLEESASARGELDELVGSDAIAQEEVLADYGPAPEFEGIQAWINSQPLTRASTPSDVL